MSEKIIFGGGCFWCIEAVFQRVRGVEKVVSGYSGGQLKNPSYREVCSGDTGHAEVVEIEFDRSIVSLEVLLDIFWHLHDPTTLNRQGADVGTQYRSAIYYYNDVQKEVILKSKNNLEESGDYQDPVVTEIAPVDGFFKAEDYHQNFFNNNPSQGYCRVVISPKLSKLLAKFSDRLK